MNILIKQGVILLLIYSNISLGFAKILESCDGQGYKIFFGNGIQNTKNDMIKSSDKIQEIIGNSYKGQPVVYGVAENPSSGLLESIIEVIKQKINEDDKINWEVVAKVV